MSASETLPESGAITVHAVIESIANVSIVENETCQRAGGQLDSKSLTEPSRPVRTYTRRQLVFLHGSPLVTAPSDMPALKDWFGSENELNLNKKEPETSSSTGTRDRRFRRDPEDGEGPARPTFRPTLTQPSQMGNFKHHSLRTSDRDRDRDAEKDRERDIREKEGQERLRNLSDKYDRDRLALPARNKQRDTAPHLATSASRLGTQTQLDNAASRRAETRDPGKKKAGESSEDWRRGAEPPRPGREDRHDNRKERDDRERPRSRVRDSSRSRRDTSRSKRDRGERDGRDHRGDLDREDFLRGDRDDNHGRDKDPEREGEPEDPRRWWDDGKRDERMAARRYGDRERARDRGILDGWDPSHDRGQERRWTVVEERDVRSKRSSGRERRSGAVAEDGKEKDDRRERERKDREREKEPAWMDTYIPSNSTAGILGGKGGDGELDGIQAWKKGMKEKEQMEKGSTSSTSDSAKIDQSEALEMTEASSAPSLLHDKQLDEIQLFKLMMKREEEKKKTDSACHGIADDTRSTVSGFPVVDNDVPGLMRIREQKKSPAVSMVDNITSLGVSALDPPPGLQSISGVGPSHSLQNLPPATSQINAPQVTSSQGPTSLLSILSSSTHDLEVPPPPSLNPTVTAEASPDRSKGSRLFPKPLLSESYSEKPIVEPPSTGSPSVSQCNPPQGSRLLAFGARGPSTTQVGKSPAPPGSSASSQPPNGLQSHLPAPQASPTITSGFQNTAMSSQAHNSDLSFPQRTPTSDAHRTQQGFSPFENTTRPSFGFEESREGVKSGNHYNSLHHQPGHERPPNMFADPGSGHADLGSPNPGYTMNNSASPHEIANGAAGYATSKGSRFAKFFDGKAREGQTQGNSKGQGPVGNVSSSPNSLHRQDSGVFNGALGGGQENRAIDDIFAMLNSSAQGQRVNSANQSSSSNSIPFGQNMQSQQQQQHQHHLAQSQQHIPSSNRLDSFYESRLDDRNFLPDGMVPGLRSTSGRHRENGGMFSDALDDPISFNPQRPHFQHRGIDHMYSGTTPLMYSQQPGLGRSAGIQQPPYRGGPSPSQSLLQGPQQRLPPGLANLGGRPPHEPSHFNAQIGMTSGGLHGSHGNTPSLQSFNNFGPGMSSMGYSGGPQLRGGPPPSHHMQTPLPHNPMGGLGGMDPRSPSHLLGMGNGGGLRGVGAGFGPHHGPNGQMQTPLLALRQQQQHLPPHMMPHLLPPHLQQQSLPTPDNQPAHDLMALLMGAPHRG